MDCPPENDVCSICHGNFHVPCQSNCSHWFCANCILQVWDHGSALQACKCPLCRRPITLLVPSDSASRLHRDPEVPEVLRRVEHYNRHFGQHSSSLFQRMQDLPFLLRRLLRDMTDPQRSLPFVIRARVYLAVVLSGIYVLSPVDIIPEGVLGIIGLLDDLIIMFICFLHVAALYRSVLLFRHGGS
ncbi:PREDICTED: E3 ubiquitin-protein ligase RNF170-like [Nicotiana attenuata]|uniref:E3 ubiquitin-protein ligase RNF170 n=1 Tax=Nicotiana attenuata TaxID=49451 RepID=A0A1J6IGS6_NICAT|nr:PREDICTED: E3 ubiquitin-protein ligase RNF170-like [Nicotiana attenuata]OIT04277.1 hypothetical protein A4A49_11686 [Nicotiana attenuata]